MDSGDIILALAAVAALEEIDVAAGRTIAVAASTDGVAAPSPPASTG